MSSHLYLQDPTRPPLIVQHPSQMRGEQPQADHREVELHRRTVIADGSGYRLDCSCGYLSPAYHLQAMAATKGCEVEHELAISKERRRRMHSSHRSMSVSDPVSRR